MEVTNTQYKDSEIGLIPSDWFVHKLSTITMEIGDGIHTTPSYVNDSEYHFINGNNLDNGIIRCYDETKCISKEEYELLKKNLNQRTILMSINGTIGNLAFFNNEKVILGKSAAYINLNDKVDKRFIFFLLQHSSIKSFYENELTGTTIRNLSLKSIRETPIPLPPTKSEQTAIATALSDADALIENLEKLIEKKRNIKQGVMQELLTGEKRLAGYNGKWEAIKLGDICDIRKGQLITEKTATGGEFPVIAGGINPSYFHNRPNRANNTITISASGANAGFVSFHKYPIFASDCSTIEDKGTFNILYLFFVLQLSQQQIFKLQTGGAQPHVYPEHLKPLELILPQDFSEQDAIAKILIDIDEELSFLEKQMNKYKLIKQGMLQTLLTGKIRLV